MLSDKFGCYKVCMLILFRCASGDSRASALRLHIFTSSHLCIFMWESIISSGVPLGAVASGAGGSELCGVYESKVAVDIYAGKGLLM